MRYMTLGIVAALLHSCLVGGVLFLILYQRSQSPPWDGWPIVWLFLWIVDFPASLLYWAGQSITYSLDVPWYIHTIVMPAFVTASLGGLQWYLIGRWIEKRYLTRLLDWTRCRQCGYSLVGNTSKRCPECGLPYEFLVPAHAGESITIGKTEDGRKR